MQSYFNFSLTTGIIKKHDKILIMAKSKLDSIETLVYQTLTDMEISYEEFHAIIREKKIGEDKREREDYE